MYIYIYIAVYIFPHSEKETQLFDRWTCDSHSQPAEPARGLLCSLGLSFGADGGARGGDLYPRKTLGRASVEFLNQHPSKDVEFMEFHLKKLQICSSRVLLLGLV